MKSLKKIFYDWDCGLQVMQILMQELLKPPSRMKICFHRKAYPGRSLSSALLEKSQGKN